MTPAQHHKILVVQAGAEVWKPVPAYGQHYEASSCGRIRVKDRIVVKAHRSGCTMRQHYPMRLLIPYKKSRYGHLCVHIEFNGQKRNVAVHRMVLFAFVGPAPAGCEACHNDGDATNNQPSNLRWDTHAANNADRKRHGRYALGEHHHAAKLTTDQVLAIRGGTLTAEQAGICREHFWSIRSRRSWRHL